MGKTNKVLATLVGNLIARAATQGRAPNSVQLKVLTRLTNAAAIEDSIAALNAAESGK